MYKIIFIDIDGTLRNNKKQISKRCKDAINNLVSNGILVVLTSGRPNTYTENISKEVGASRYIISSNGGSIYDYKEKKNLYTNVMNKEEVLKLYNIANNSGVRFIMNTNTSRVVTKLKHYDGSEIELKEDIELFVNKNDITQCVISDQDFYKMKMVKKEVVKLKDVEIKYQAKKLLDESEPITESTTIDIANINSSKGNAIKILCTILKIDLKDTIAIGDDANDISMLKTVGYAVAMDNAINRVKEYADEITKSNEEDGVAIFLEKLNRIIKEEKNEKYKRNSEEQI